MNDLETRLRRAFEARTANVPTPPEPDWKARPGRVYPILGVMAAVAATLAVLLSVNLLQGTDGPAFTPGSVPATAVRPANSPTFAIRQDDEYRPQIVDVATGRVLGTVEPPAGYDVLWASNLAAAADNRTFFFTVRKSLNSLHYLVARVHVDDRGRPDGRAVLVAETPRTNELDSAGPPLKTPNTNEPSRWATMDRLWVSPDATRIAMGVSSRRSEGLTLWDLTTGRHTTWGGTTGVDAVAWGKDGSLLWASGRSAGKLDPDAAPTPLRPDRTFPEVGDLTDSVLLPNGDRIAVLLGAGNPAKLARIPSTGSMQVLDQWAQNGDDEGGVMVDAGGKHVLYLRHGEMVRMDLTTRKRSPSALGGELNKMTQFAW
jgi:hypothetical protein